MIRTVITTSLAALLSGWALPEESRAQVVSQPPAQPLSITGAWRIAEVVRDSAGTTIARVQPGIYLFTQTHYSVTRVDSNTPRRDFPGELRRTADTYLEIWGPFTAHAGTYEIQGDRITTRPVIAKNPSGMQASNYNTLTWRMLADTLWLQTIANQSGPVTDGTMFKLVRAER